MSISVLVGDDTIKKSNNKLRDYKFSLDIRQTLGGDYVIYDHPDIDIVVMPKLKKVVAFPKDKISELTYDTESRLFDFLTKKGVIARDSVQGGNVYASLQGLFETPPEPKGKEGEEERCVYVYYVLSNYLIDAHFALQTVRRRNLHVLYVVYVYHL